MEEWGLSEIQDSECGFSAGTGMACDKACTGELQMAKLGKTFAKMTIKHILFKNWVWLPRHRYKFKRRKISNTKHIRVCPDTGFLLRKKPLDMLKHTCRENNFNISFHSWSYLSFQKLQNILLTFCLHSAWSLSKLTQFPFFKSLYFSKVLYLIFYARQTDTSQNTLSQRTSRNTSWRGLGHIFSGWAVHSEIQPVFALCEQSKSLGEWV